MTNLRVRRFLLLLVGILLVVGVVLVLFFRAGRSSSRSVESKSKGSKSGLLQNGAFRQEILDRPESSLRKGPNAADFYKNAFVLWNALTADEKKCLLNPREEIDEAKAVELFNKIQPIMELLRKARLEANYCDWGMDLFEGQSKNSQLMLFRDLALTARWDAAYIFQSDPNEAISVLSDQAALGHGASCTLNGVLVGMSLNQTITNLVHDNLGNLSVEARENALTLLRNSTLNADFSQAMNREADFQESKAAQLLDPTRIKSTMDIFYGEGAANLQEPQDFTQEDLTQYAQLFTQMAKLNHEFAKNGGLPDPEFNAWRAQINSLNEATLGAMINSVRASYQAATVNNSMLAVGLSILQAGSSQLTSQTDPTTGQPFIYVQTPTGFELRSPFKFKGKAVTMTFSNP